MIKLSEPLRPVSDVAISDPDVRLMLRVSDGDCDAFAELVDRYERRVFGVLRRLLNGNWQMVEDLAQDVFLRVYRARTTYTPRSRFSNWLFTIVHNVASNAKRTLARRRESRMATDDDFRTDPFDELAGTSAEPLTEAIRNETRSMVRDSIEQLKPRQREAIAMNKLEGLSHCQIARRMRTTPDAIKSLLARARGHLRQSLSGEESE